MVASANTISDPLARGWSGIDALIPWASRRQAPVSNMSTETDNPAHGTVLHLCIETKETILCDQAGSHSLVSRLWRYPMVKVFTTRLNCFPICDLNADDAALTLPISPPLLKSWAPCRVMFWGGFSPR